MAPAIRPRSFIGHGAESFFVVAIVGLMLLPSCGASTSSTSASTQAATTVADGALFSGAQFYELVREDDGGFFEGKEDSEIDVAARFVCGVFTPSTGGDPTTQWVAAIKGLIALGFDAKTAGGFTVYAVTQQCIQELRYLPKG